MPRPLHLTLLAGLLLFPLFILGQSTSTEPAATIHTGANLVIIDVVATDSQHNPIHKLASTDFTVLEDGKPQVIKAFEEHSAAEQAAPLPPMPKLPPNTFTNYSPTPAGGALNVLLLDALNTPQADQGVVHDQVVRYLKEARPGTRMAIFGLTTQLRLLQGFTSDPELLRAVLNGKKGRSQSSPILADAIGTDTPGSDDALMNDTADALGNTPDAATILANLAQFQAMQQAFQLQLRIDYTLDALNTLAHYLSRLPGRKNLIWFSGSFPISVLPDGDLQNPFAVTASYEQEFRETTSMLARSQVAVYPIDARGLMTLPMLNASNGGTKYARNPGAFGKDTSKFLTQTADEHSTMQQMAEATGGVAFYNTNGLKEAVEKSIENGSNYYTIAYSPANQEWKGDYRKIQLKFVHSGVSLSYRRGYYADDPNSPTRRGEFKDSTPADHAPQDPMRVAMLRGGPDPVDIIFDAQVTLASTAPEAAVANGNTPSPKALGPWRRYSILFGIDPHDISCPVTADAVYHCSLQSVVFAYDRDGVLLNMHNIALKADIPPARIAVFQHSGIHFRSEISVPVKGEAYLRIGVHDMTTGRVGALEVPVTDIRSSPQPPASSNATMPSQ